MTLTRPERVAAAVALVLDLLRLAFIPDAGTDTAAQLARAAFARDHPFTPVDFSWFGGVHPFGYSLLAPGIMAVLGVTLAGLLATVAMSVLFARLVRDSHRPTVAAVFGAVFAVANDASGRTTFALGGAAALATLLMRPHRGRSVAFAVLTGLLSPVAAAFLGLAAAVLVLRRQPCGWSIGLGCTIPVSLLAFLFPGGGVQPYSIGAAIPLVLISLAIAKIADHPLISTGALVYAVGVVFFTIDMDPFGSNVQRLAALIASSMLVAYSRKLTAFVMVAVVGCLIWQFDPTRDDLRSRPGPDAVDLAAELVRLDAQRVEVVPARDHREAYEVARYVGLARGWSRQLDVAANPLFYRGRLDATKYLAWLRDNAVDHVAMPRQAVLDYGSTREGRLLRNPVPGLQQVWSDADWTLYAVDEPVGIADAPVVSVSRTQVVLRSDSADEVLVRLRWSRWLTLDGPGCLVHSGRWVRVRFTGQGEVRIGSSLLPHGHC